MLTRPPRDPSSRSAEPARRLLRPSALLLAAVLIGVAALLAPAPRAADAQSDTVWSATLTVQTVGSGRVGCSLYPADNPANKCSNQNVLTDNSFTVAGTDYRIDIFGVTSTSSGRELTLRLNKSILDSLKGLTLVVDGKNFLLSQAHIFTDDDVVNDSASWGNTGLSWSTGDQVEVKLLKSLPGGVLVSNIGQSGAAGQILLNSRLQAQGFTTGDHASGYGLISIEVDTSAVSAPAGMKAEVWSAASNGRPDAKLGNLIVPSTISSGATTFAAPAGTWLKANTAYFVVLYRASGSDGNMRFTNSTDEDSGAASGWSIDGQYWRDTGGVWTSSAPKIKIRVNGAVPSRHPGGTRRQDEKQIWSTTMSAKNLEPTRWGTNSSGCRSTVSEGTCPVAMGSNSFTYAGNTYTITDFYHRNGTLSAGLSSSSAAAITAAKSLMLIVKYSAGAERRFPLRNLTASGTSATVSWPVDDMRWGSYGKPHSDPQRNPAVWGAYDAGVTLAVVEVPEPVTVTVTSPAPRTHTVTVSVPTAVTRETIISLSSYGRVSHRVQTDLRDPDLISHCDPMDPWDPVFLNSDRKYPYAHIQAGSRSTTFNLCIMEVQHDVANQTLTSEVTVYLPRGRSSVTYDINVGSAYGVGSGAASGAAEFRGGEGPSSGEEQQRDLLTAAFEDVPEEHDGTEFALRVRLSETVGRFSRSPRASSFAVTRGRVTGVEQVGAGLWRVTVRPTSPSDVTVTLEGGRDCDDEPSGAVCTPDGRALSNTSTARVAAGPQQQQVGAATPEPADVQVVPGDGSLTVSWTAVAHPLHSDARVQHALRWSQEAGVWANPQGNNGVAVEAGVNSYTITGLTNGVATGVFVRAFVGGLRSESSEHSSGWVRVKGEQTTPRAAVPEPKTITVPDDGTPEQQQQQTAEPVETPGPVVNLQLLGEGKKVIVSWEAPASGGAVDNYILHIKNLDTGKGKDRKVAAGKTTTTFRNLKPGETYRVWVRAHNEGGKGERVHARITLPE